MKKKVLYVITPWGNRKKGKREPMINTRETSKFSCQTRKPCKRKLKQDKTKQKCSQKYQENQHEKEEGESVTART